MNKELWDKLDIETKIMHSFTEEKMRESVITPIYQTTSYRFSEPEQVAEQAAQIAPATHYTRYGSPNTKAVERILVDLEGAEAALVLGSGMAAMTVAVLSNLQSGDHIIAQLNHYNVTTALLKEILPKFSIEVSFVKASDTKAFADAIRPNTRLVITETPVNPTLEITNLLEVSNIAHDKGALVITDNTFASSFNQRPLEFGVDIVVHSASKYLNGHSDVIAGAIVGGKEVIEKAWKYSRIHGAVLHPFDAWLFTRGLRTYQLRMNQHNKNALAIARYLEKHPAIDKVNYPGLVSHPQHELACQQMSGGFGGMVSFEIKGDSNSVNEVIRNVRLCVSAVSLGGPETLISHPAAVRLLKENKGAGQEGNIPENLIRLSVGLESSKDIISDLEIALSYI